MGLFKNWPSFPAALSDTAWNKQKGVVAKVLKGETGIGASLQAAESAFHQVKAHCFVDNTVDTSNPAACDKALQEANAEYGDGVKKCTDKLKELKANADDQAAKFKKNPLIPKSSREYLEQMSAAAQKFADDLRQFCQDSIKDINTEKAKLAAH